MENIWKSKEISMDLKLRFLRASVSSIATYGSESWAMTKNDRKRVDAFEMWCYRRLLRVSWKDKRTNDWVLSRVGCELMLRKTIDSRKLRYFGYIIVERMTALRKLLCKVEWKAVVTEDILQHYVQMISRETVNWVLQQQHV